MSSDAQKYGASSYEEEGSRTVAEGTERNDSAPDREETGSEQPEQFLHGYKLVMLLLCVCGCEFLVSLG